MMTRTTVREGGVPPPNIERSSKLILLESAAAACGNGKESCFYIYRKPEWH